MNNQDPIADMLTRIRNANRVGRRLVLIPKSKICTGIAQVLKDEGYIEEYAPVDDGQQGGQGQIRVKLKYSITGEKVIHSIDRYSKPGCRVYSSVENLPNVLNGMGIAVVSTSKGVMSDRKARESNVGGELLCTVS
jgi:small subunit ribosomal protein S8